MLTYLRYALATTCFALSVACLGLWWRSATHHDQVSGPALNRSEELCITSFRGACKFALYREFFVPTKWRLSSTHISVVERLSDVDAIDRALAGFALTWRSVIFPLWYPALVFALAGVGALRLGRRFTLRSAIIATTVVAGLLGMVVVVVKTLTRCKAPISA